ncbi:hypothetical protein CERSUDRAFT_88374 [Gelatoporia subvermispora B]|uniref:Uncharacterized protein n=1 Tax=Ceriporiopsis subvermispora (strain B) TaxID=914234 RepID=M2QJ04_CERS8|nr:hypothetical protein CERSUDRAFT_88374 [Gelatoporia subvermispora B]
MLAKTTVNVPGRKRKLCLQGMKGLSRCLLHGSGTRRGRGHAMSIASNIYGCMPCQPVLWTGLADLPEQHVAVSSLLEMIIESHAPVVR